MINFDNREYAILMSNLLHDTRYVEISNMGKVAGIRKHAEVLVRKILNIGSDSSLMLGEVRINSRNSAIKSGMDSLGTDLSDRLIQIVNVINPIGRDGTHTQHIDDFTYEEVGKIEDALLDLYALIFIKYFLDYQIDIYFSPLVLHEFSFLPPIIRYKTWNYLYEKDKNNIQIVNKLCLSIIKTYNKETAYDWLEANSEEIKMIPYPTAAEKEKYIKLGGVEVAPGMYQVSLDFDRFDNIYSLLYQKISDARTSVNESGKMYSDFEEAVKYYTDFRDLDIVDYSDEVNEFHSLMEFVFMGRKSKDELTELL